MNNHIIITYADGNGNVYTIAEKTMEYHPITPEISSSGEYSGGEYRKKDITPGMYNRINKQINRAIKNTSIHINARVMGSGLITIREPDKKTTYLIAGDAKEKEQIEDLLAGLMD